MWLSTQKLQLHYIIAFELRSHQSIVHLASLLVKMGMEMLTVGGMMMSMIRMVVFFLLGQLATITTQELLQVSLQQ